MRIRSGVLVVAVALIAVPPAQGWSWPVDGPVLQPFVFGDDPYAPGQHRGIDIGAAVGAAVVAPAGGEVSYAGTVPTSGKSVTIRTPDGYSVTLTHLGSISVAKGDAVREEAAVATIETSGAAEHDVPYVHLGVRRTSDPQGYLDPLLFLPARAAPAARPPASPPAPAPALAPAPAPAAAPAPASAARTPASSSAVREPAAAPTDAELAATAPRISAARPLRKGVAARGSGRGATDPAVAKPVAAPAAAPTSPSRQ
jgi:hypothetical protein